VFIFVSTIYGPIQLQLPDQEITLEGVSDAVRDVLIIKRTIGQLFIGVLGSSTGTNRLKT